MPAILTSPWGECKNEERKNVRKVKQKDGDNIQEIQEIQEVDVVIKKIKDIFFAFAGVQ